MAINNLDLQIVPSLNQDDVEVQGVGSNLFALTSDAAAAFGLTDGELRDLFHKWTQSVDQEMWCDSIGYTSDADLMNAPGRNHANMHNHLVNDGSGDEHKITARARIIQTPVSAKVVSVDKSPDIIDRVIWDNSMNDQPREHNAKISVEVENTVESNWHEDHSISESVTIGVEIGSEVSGVKGKFESETSYGFSWGKGGSKSKSVHVGSEAGISGMVAAGRIEVAALVANRGTLIVDMVVESKVTGALLFQIWHKHHHHFWNIDGHLYPNIWLDLETLALPSSLSKQETVRFKYDFYADDRVSSFPVSASDSKTVESEVLAAITSKGD